MSKLVLAEKPSVAQSIAKVLGANRRCDGYLDLRLRPTGAERRPDISSADAEGLYRMKG